MIDTARRGAGGGLPIPCGATAPGGDRRNLKMFFAADLSSAAPAPDHKAASAPFKFSDLLQAVIDVTALVFIPLFVAIAAVGVGIAFFILFFVVTR